jgi:hypothetical protein
LIYSTSWVDSPGKRRVDAPVENRVGIFSIFLNIHLVFDFLGEDLHPVPLQLAQISLRCELSGAL